MSVILGSEPSECLVALEIQLAGLQGKLLDTDVRLSRLVLALEQGADVAPVVTRISELHTERERLSEEIADKENSHKS